MTLKNHIFFQRSLDIICIKKVKVFEFLKHDFSPRKIIPFQLCFLLEKKFIILIMNVFWYAVSYLHFYDLIKSSESLRWDYFDREIGEWSREEKRKAKSLRFDWVPFKLMNKVHVCARARVCVLGCMWDSRVCNNWIQVENSHISIKR